MVRQNPPPAPAQELEQLRAKRPTAERLYTLHEAAGLLGLKYHQLQRPTSRGEIPSYRPFGRRIYVRLSEVIAYIEAHKNGGTL